jgi:glyoxylase-like metal-dependent hydrolase (beta-lactamase superfamily II)
MAKKDAFRVGRAIADARRGALESPDEQVGRRARRQTGVRRVGLDPRADRWPDGVPVDVAAGILGVRLPLPFALDHVNVWLLADGAGWLAIDTGIADDPTRARWRGLLDRLSPGRLTRLLCTHFHPDHIGLAGWLAAETGVPLLASRTEWLLARMLALDDGEGFLAALQRYDRRAGLPPALAELRQRRGNAYRPRVVVPPATYQRLEAGMQLTVGEQRFEVLIGRGHAPEMICLFEPERRLLIAADQVLPTISPNVSVWPIEPLADPLSDFLATLEAFRVLPGDTLVLPSHGRPFVGLHARIDALIRHHAERLAQVESACAAPRTAHDLIPLLFERALDAHQLQFALGETVAHLNHLLAKGVLVAAEELDGRLLYQRR